MVGKWNKNDLKAEILQFFYMHLFTFQVILLWLQYSFECDGWIVRWRAAEFQQELIRDLFDLLIHLTNRSRNFFLI